MQGMEVDEALKGKPKGAVAHHLDSSFLIISSQKDIGHLTIMIAFN